MTTYDLVCTHLNQYFETDLFEAADFLNEECAAYEDGAGFNINCKDYITDQEIGDLLLRGFYGGDSE